MKISFLYFISILAIIKATVVENDTNRIWTVPSSPILKNIDESLNLTCLVQSTNGYKLSWTIGNEQKDDSRIYRFRSQNKLTIIIHQLQEADSGHYICEGNYQNITLTKLVQVKIRSNDSLSCAENHFSCGNGICIPKRYTCDGFPDCPLGHKDEAISYCGSTPCKDKIHCDDGRCIAPELCCNSDTNPECLSLYLVPCCNHLINQIEIKASSSSSTFKHDINFIQSTVYTIVSCAIAFTFITLIMIIAICRIHMKRTAMSLTPNQPYLHRGRNSLGGVALSRRLFYWPWRHSRINERNLALWSSGEDCDSSEAFSRELLRPYPNTISSTGSFVVMYSNANGIQLVQSLPKPPPYSEAPLVHSPPINECTNDPSDQLSDPPPAYTSMESIHQS